MKPLTDSAVARLQTDMQLPDLSGTRYRVIRYLARGGMGTVWLVEDTVLLRRVALKVLDLVSPAEDVAERLLQEARILASLEHPGIVPGTRRRHAGRRPRLLLYEVHRRAHPCGACGGKRPS